MRRAVTGRLAVARLSFLRPSLSVENTCPHGVRLSEETRLQANVALEAPRHAFHNVVLETHVPPGAGRLQPRECSARGRAENIPSRPPTGLRQFELANVMLRRVLRVVSYDML